MQLGMRLGVHFFVLQKRNVWIRYAFRYALLTLLKGDKWGKRVKKRQKNGFFLVFKGRKSKEKTVFRGRNSQESAYFQGFARIDVKFGCAFGFYSRRIMPMTIATAWISE